MRWIVFDYGEVISKRTNALPELAEVLGADPIAFESSYWAHREAYDRGLADLEYWSLVAGQSLEPQVSAQLTKIDTTGWLSVEQSTMDLIADVKAAGPGLALLSNAPSAFGRMVEVEAWSKQFAHLMFSGDLGIAKPDAEIWAALLDRIGAQPADCVFFDDRQVNIDGATAAGLHGRLWRSAAQARTDLAGLGWL
ncbi:putative hydrolase of the HAD superfamily [Kibdelosporangium banguiense]|uniref:Hydrolase of the HAD superfamily n=1 Tax=Kibdelosporangium banguiense TaxID=1365924 RepID=A0ABS4TDD0_9PSEU|nr:HAD-IA family hydrolase [Kibdelosporangium banguiense]MBP2322070.1 putative hydrolase of the HAD superfamily [Kibdelosporangium banguiense]